MVGVRPLHRGDPRHEPEVAMVRLRVDATLGDPGYGNRYPTEPTQ
tara:strand:- start:2868 stop:3002 length:135 start_codon:yes stop_codon:yes gene_type:complete